jgi:hypothetical protein
VTVSAGSAPFILYIDAPDGHWTFLEIYSSGTYSVPEAEGEPAEGTWYLSIESLGTVSTARAYMHAEYEY